MVVLVTLAPPLGAWSQVSPLMGTGPTYNQQLNKRGLYRIQQELAGGEQGGAL